MAMANPDAARLRPLRVLTRQRSQRFPHATTAWPAMGASASEAGGGESLLARPVAMDVRGQARSAAEAVVDGHVDLYAAAAAGPKAEVDDGIVAARLDPQGLEDDLLPGGREVVPEELDPVPAAVDVHHVRKDAGRVPLDLRPHEVGRALVVALVPAPEGLAKLCLVVLLYEA